MKEFDIIVVGGGPSGSTCAALVGMQGKDVLLLEKAAFPRDKTCGDAVSGRSMKALQALGIEDQIQKVQQDKIKGIIFSGPEGKLINIPRPTSDNRDYSGYVCKRELVDNIFFQNAKEYATVKEEVTVVDLIIENEKVVGVVAKDKDGVQEFRAKIVVGADGANSIVAKKIGVPAHPGNHTSIAARAYYSGVELFEEKIELHFVDEILPGYFWIFPVGNGEANVGIGMLASEIQKRKVNLEKELFDIIENNPLFKDRFKNAKRLGPVKAWRLPMGSKHRKVAFDGCILLGDAACLVDPFTGEGIGTGTTSARIAAKVIMEAFKESDFSESFLMKYEKQLWEEVGPGLKASHRLQMTLNFKPLLNFMIRRIEHSKELQDMIAGTLLQESKVKLALTPHTIWKMLTAKSKT